MSLSIILDNIIVSEWKIKETLRSGTWLGLRGAWAQRSQAFAGKFLHSDSVQFLLTAPELKKLLICSVRTLNLSGVCVCICVMGVLRRFHGAYNSRTINRAIPCIQRRLLSGPISKINGGGSVLPVLIVGAGPVGLVLSILLTKLGNVFGFIEVQ